MSLLQIQFLACNALSDNSHKNILISARENLRLSNKALWQSQNLFQNKVHKAYTDMHTHTHTWRQTYTRIRQPRGKPLLKISKPEFTIIFAKDDSKTPDEVERSAAPGYRKTLNRKKRITVHRQRHVLP